MTPGVALVLLVLLQGAPTDVRADALCDPGATVALDGLGTPADDLLRTAELAGAAVPTPQAIRRAGARTAALCEGGPPLPWQLPAAEPADDGWGRVESRLVPFRLSSVFSSTYPSSGNDGLLWAGRGLSGMLSGGAALRWGHLSAALVPELAASANEPFDIVPNGRTGDARFMNPYYGEAIDFPQRFGSAPFARFAPGQSYLRLDVANFAAGISTENLWFGPGQRNALLMTNSGPGFPHAFLGTSRPGDIWIGKAEAFFFWGKLERSRYFTDQRSALLTGMVVDYAPRWVPTLTLGFARVFVEPWSFTLGRVLPLFQPFEKARIADNPSDNQLASLFVRWVFPESGLAIHLEWGREDHEWSFWNFVQEPDHSQAYVLGLEKVWVSGPRWVRFQAEITHLQEKRPLENQRGVPVWYIHGENLGYTNEGQLLGASIGPGGDSQMIALDVFGARGRIGGFIERIRRNDEYYWAVVEPLSNGPHHDTELTFGLRGVHLRGGLEISWEAAAAHRPNRDFGRVEQNLRLSVGLAYPASALPRPAEVTPPAPAPAP